MKPTLLLLILAVPSLLSGCATPAQTYLSSHPGLPAAHQKILVTGKIPDGDAVAGMTREEVRLAMKKDPTQFTKVNGLDAWVYANEKGHSPDLTGEQGEHHEHGEAGAAGGAGSGSAGGSSSTWFTHDAGVPSNNPFSDAPDAGSYSTTIVFQGDRAIRADVTREGP